MMLPYLLIFFFAISPPQSAERQPLYAEHLFDRGAYESAILEFKRFLFYHPDTGRAGFVRYRIAQSYYYHGETVRAQKMFKDFMEAYSDSPFYLHAHLMLGQTYFDAGDYSDAQAIFFQVVNADGDKQVMAQAQYLRGWCYIYERNWLKAIAEFRKVRQFQSEGEVGAPDRTPRSGAAAEPETSLSLTATRLADTTLANTPLPLKSPKRAHWMSTFLPGAGQIYAGKVGNGLISAVMNAAFFYLLADSFREERYVDAVGIGLVGARFYLGNRYNAKQWTIEHNRRIEEDFIRQLKGQSEEIERRLSLPNLPE